MKVSMQPAAAPSLLINPVKYDSAGTLIILPGLVRDAVLLSEHCRQDLPVSQYKLPRLPTAGSLDTSGAFCAAQASLEFVTYSPWNCLLTTPLPNSP